MMKKVIFGDFTEYNSPTGRLGNYHYCNCFLKEGYEALWISNAFNQLIYFKDREDYYFKKRISSAQRHILAENVYGFAPYSWRLYGDYPFFRNTNILKHFEKYIKPDISASLKKMNFLDVDILWISNPKMYWLTNVVHYNTLIYRIADDYSKFSYFPNIDLIDEMLIKKSHLTIISSKMSASHVQAMGKEPLLLNNGVNVDHFMKEDAVFPREYRRNQRRRIIYVGALKFWFDTELVAKLAQNVDADIYLIGKIETDLSSLEVFSNVHIIGPRDYSLLPGYLQHADVALIPFIKSDVTDGASPIKLYEYCAAGVAVVSTNLTDTAALNAPIWVAEDHDSFIQGVNYYLNQGYDKALLRDFCKNNTWNQRFEILKQKLAEV